MVARVGTESKNLVGPEQSGIAKVFHRELALLAKESVVCASQVQARKHLPPILPQYELAIKPRQRCRSAKSVCGGGGVCYGIFSIGKIRVQSSTSINTRTFGGTRYVQKSVSHQASYDRTSISGRKRKKGERLKRWELVRHDVLKCYLLTTLAAYFR